MSIDKDNMNDIEVPIIDRVISLIEYLSRRFYDEFLIKNFGLINPDTNQINDRITREFKDIFDAEKPFLLNPDNGGIGAVTSLKINSDD